MIVVHRDVEDMPGLVPIARAIITLDLPGEVGVIVGGLIGELVAKQMRSDEEGTLTVTDSKEQMTLVFRGEN